MVIRQLLVNPILCTGHGVCAELVPELVQLDPWGYPLMIGRDLPEDLIDHARRAVTACPALALLIHETQDRP